MTIRINQLTKKLALRYIQEIIDLYNISMGSLKEKYTEEMVLKDLLEKWRLSFIALKENQLVGFLVSSVYGKKIAHIHQISISPNYQNQGIGMRLLNRLVKRCVSINIKTITLECNINNEKAITFYKGNGFKKMNSMKIKDYLTIKNKLKRMDQFYPLSPKGIILVLYKNLNFK